MSTNKTLEIKNLQLRNDVASNWAEKNPVLLKGEMGVEIDTNKFKFGDGVKTWSELSYNGIVVSQSENNGYVLIDGAEVKIYELEIGGANIGGVKTQTAGTDKVVIGADGTMSVSEVSKAIQLTNARKFSISGDGTSEQVTFNGTGDVVLALTLANSGVTAGTYTKLTVDAKGRVTAGASLTATDIPDLTLAKITDAGTAAAKNVGANAGNVPLLDSNGKLDTSVIPDLAITEPHVVASETEMLALTAQKGDFAIRTDVNKTFVLKDSPASTLSNWVELRNTSAVLSVNNKTGAVTLTTSDIAEGSNLYYTEERATSNFNTNFALKNVTDLADGANVVKDTDTISLDCGNA